MADSNRIQKINQLFQEQLAESMRQKAAKDFPGVLLSVTEVRTTADLSISKCYISIFPDTNRNQIFKQLKQDIPYYRNVIGQTVAKKMRKVPEINFYMDTSIEQAEEIDQALKGKGNNPIL